MGMQVVLMMMKIWVLLIALSVHGSADLVESQKRQGKLVAAAPEKSPHSSWPTGHSPTKDLVESQKGHGKLAAAGPEKSPQSSWPTGHSPTKAPFPHKLMRPTSIAVAPSMPSLNGHAKKWPHSSASSPLAPYYKHHHARNRLRSSAPEPSHKLPHTFSPRGSSSSPSQAPFPSSLAPAPSPTILSRRINMPVVSPTISPLSPSLKKARIPPPSPFLTLPPPPPNEDCASVTCPEPLTYAPPGLHCGCVWPIQVKLHLSIELYTFFPLVSELAKEIAASLSLNNSQVRIMGANEAKQQLDKTAVLVNLVPLGEKFNDATASLTYKKFWHGQVLINTSLFGAYDVLYVRYPGLPPSPPSSPSSISSMDDGPYRSSSNGNNGRTIKPIGVDVRQVKKDGEKDGLSKSMIAVIVLSSFTAFVICVGVSWLLLLNFGACAQKPEQIPHTLLSSPAKPSGGSMKPMISGNKASSASISFGSSTLTYTGSAKTFTLADIERATSSFEASRIVGEGGFGVVYRGILDDGREVAVKVLKREDQHGGREFLAEVEMLGRLHHRNLVKLIGICIEGHIRCLVYELVPNGSVESHLHGVDKETGPLDWDARVKIALGAARGLAYLHEDSSPRVIHRDFKSSNILLEQDFTPKVSDFGLARAAHDEGNRHISTRVMGTFGYLAPEYAMTGHLLVKSDVYSYGVVLLELLTGRKPVDLLQPPGQENLVSWAHPLLTSKESLETIIDPTIKPDPILFESVVKVAAIASMCVQPEVSNRPFMGEVVQALQLVCSEYEERVEKETRSNCNQKNLSKINVDSNVGAEMGLSASCLLGAPNGLEAPEIESFESSGRHSSSVPIGTGRKRRQFWERLKSLSGGSMSEHESSHKLWHGSQ